MPTDPIHIRISASKSESISSGNRRKDFWTGIGQTPESSQALAVFERVFCRKFSRTLQGYLLNHFAEPLHAIRSQLFTSMTMATDHLRLRRSEDNIDDYPLNEMVRLWIETETSESAKKATERLSTAARITFSTNIAGYSSLDLHLVATPFSQVVSAFESDFESFRVFLEVFVPQAFADAAACDSADVAATINCPQAVRDSFRATAIQATGSQTDEPSHQQVVAPGPSVARERAEWLWRLANGSLLIPTLLALLVMYLGLGILGELRRNQSAAMAPILEHQLKLLEEDRQRLLLNTTLASEDAPSPDPEN